MTRETSQESQSGPKKFLYSGPQKSTQSAFEDDVGYQQQAAFTTITTQPSDSHSGFDFDEVWSLRKNVNIGKTLATPSRLADGGTRNVSKGYYSRYGKNNGDDDFASSFSGTKTKDSEQSPVVQKTFSYSYTNNNTASTPTGNPGKTEIPGRYGNMTATTGTTYGSSGVGGTYGSSGVGGTYGSSGIGGTHGSSGTFTYNGAAGTSRSGGTPGGNFHVGGNTSQSFHGGHTQTNGYNKRPF